MTLLSRDLPEVPFYEVTGLGDELTSLGRSRLNTLFPACVGGIIL